MISPCTNKLVYLKKAGLKLSVQKTKIMLSGSISSVQFIHSVMSDSLQPHELQHAGLLLSSLSLSLLKLMSIESVVPSNHLILCNPLLLLPSIFSSIRVFSSE